MARAMLYPEPEKGGRDRKQIKAVRNALETKAFSEALLSQARTVLDHSKPLADAVLAGLKPLDVVYQEALITSENSNRRHLTPSQRAMAVAFAHPEPVKYKRGGSPLAAKDLSATTLSQARTVNRENRQLAMEVMAGTKSVEAAYSEIRTKAKVQEQSALISVYRSWDSFPRSCPLRGFPWSRRVFAPAEFAPKHEFDRPQCHIIIASGNLIEPPS
ncbi:hypothetical protein LJR235_003558 [Pararhizobium sp. LjRoot235]|uniref:hypothetical protein n=1 Tax=Pararhizobium sp. LjRoot235 TaxID=3342291 RepID=UPI003ECE3CFD